MNTSKIMWIVVAVVAIGFVGLCAYALNLKYNAPPQSVPSNLTNETMKEIQPISNSSTGTTSSKSENYTPQQQEMIEQLSKASVEAEANAQKYRSTKIVNFANLFSLELPQDATAFGGDSLNSVKDSIKKSAVDVVFCETSSGCSEEGNIISISVFKLEGKTFATVQKESLDMGLEVSILNINNKNAILTVGPDGYGSGILNLYFFTKSYLGIVSFGAKDFEKVYSQILNKTDPEFSRILNSLKILE